MMNENTFITNIFNNKKIRIAGQSTDLQAPWFLDLQRADYVRFKTMSLMIKIMTDCYRFSTKIKDKDVELSLFDSIIYKESQYGLISWISFLIATESKEYLVYDNGIVRKADNKERLKIDKEYKSGNQGRSGIILDFSKYIIGKLLKHYFHQMYTVEDANEKSVALGGSIQYKVADLRKKIGFQEGQSDVIISQAAEICKYAKNGKPIVIDAADSFEQTDSSKNVSVSAETKDSIYQEMAALLGCLPSYISGIDEKTNGSGDSYERIDGRAEDMIKNFWITIFRPVVETLYSSKNVKLEFVSQKWQQIKENLGSISMIESIDAIPDDIKASVIAKLLGDNKPDPKNELEKNIISLLSQGKDEEDNAFDE